MRALKSMNTSPMPNKTPQAALEPLLLLLLLPLPLLLNQLQSLTWLLSYHLLILLACTGSAHCIQCIKMVTVPHTSLVITCVRSCAHLLTPPAVPTEAVLTPSSSSWQQAVLCFLQLLKEVCCFQGATSRKDASAADVQVRSPRAREARFTISFNKS
jgi:hypothetical protein